jgi:hypothetical protein
MAYAFVLDVPANETIYADIRSKLGDEAPDGLVAHLVLKRVGGLRYIDVWRSEAQFARFREETLEPTVTEVLAGYGLPHDHTQTRFEEVDVIDTWLGAR